MKKFIFTLTVIVVVLNFITASIFYEIQDGNLDIKSCKVKLQKNKKTHNFPKNGSENKLTNFNFVSTEKNYNDKNNFNFLETGIFKNFKNKGINCLIYSQKNNFQFNCLFLLTNQQKK